MLWMVSCCCVWSFIVVVLFFSLWILRVLFFLVWFFFNLLIWMGWFGFSCLFLVLWVRLLRFLYLEDMVWLWIDLLNFFVCLYLCVGLNVLVEVCLFFWELCWLCFVDWLVNLILFCRCVFLKIVVCKFWCVW